MKTKEKDKYKKQFINRLLIDLEAVKEKGDVDEIYKMAKNYIKIIDVQTQLSESYYKKWRNEIDNNRLADYKTKEIRGTE